MNKGLTGIERALIIKTLIQDKNPIMIRPEVSNSTFAKTLTLTNLEYRIYPQGIIFFTKFLPEWSNIYNALQVNNSCTIHMRVNFYHRGRALYFINNIRKFQNGYGIIIPQEIFKLDIKLQETKNKANGKIYFNKSSNVHATCIEDDNFPLFENSPWLNFDKKSTEKGKYFLRRIADLEETQLDKDTYNIIRVSKLLLYATEKKVPMRDFFPYPVTITSDMIEEEKLPIIESQITKRNYQLYIPLCENPEAKVHSILGLHTTLRYSPLDIAETLIKLSICKFFSQESNNEIIDKSKQDSLTIVSISHFFIALGLKFEKVSGKKYKKEHFPLQEGKEYTITITIPIGLLERTVQVNIYIKEVFTNGENDYCALCVFNDLKEEDRRFLYEKYTKSKHS